MPSSLDFGCQTENWRDAGCSSWTFAQKQCQSAYDAQISLNSFGNAINNYNAAVTTAATGVAVGLVVFLVILGVCLCGCFIAILCYCSKKTTTSKPIRVKSPKINRTWTDIP